MISMDFPDKTIEKGKLVIDVKYFFFYVHSETRDICGETSCPATGDFVLSHQQTLPGFTPPVRFLRTASNHTSGPCLAALFSNPDCQTRIGVSQTLFMHTDAF
jgi:hypothetical protein